MFQSSNLNLLPSLNFCVSADPFNLRGSCLLFLLWALLLPDRFPCCITKANASQKKGSSPYLDRNTISEIKADAFASNGCKQLLSYLPSGSMFFSFFVYRPCGSLSLCVSLCLCLSLLTSLPPSPFHLFCLLLSAT